MSLINEDQAINSLIEALNTTSYRTRNAAADALIKVGPSAQHLLVQAIKQNFFNIYTLPEVVRVLGCIGDAQAVDLLIDLLNADNIDTVREAASSLGALHDPRAILPLIDLFYYDWDETETSSVWLAASHALATFGPLALAPLLTALEGENGIVRCEIIDTLSLLGNAQATPVLLTLLQDEDWSVRVHATDALAQIGDPQAVEPLIALLKDRDKYVRCSAIRALGLLGRASVFDLLADTLHEPSPDIRCAVITTLGKMQDTRAIDLFLEALHDTDVHVRCTAAITLGKVGDERALPALLWVQEHDAGYRGVHRVKEHASYAIQHICQRYPIVNVSPLQ